MENKIVMESLGVLRFYNNAEAIFRESFLKEKHQNLLESKGNIFLPNAFIHSEYALRDIFDEILHRKNIIGLTKNWRFIWNV